MVSIKFIPNFKGYIGVLFTGFLALGMCQDRIIISNLSLDEDLNNTSIENNIIPESVLIQLASVEDASDLFRRFVTFDQVTPMFGPSVENATERRAFASAPTETIAQQANCQTEQKVVELDKPQNGADIIWPSCVRVRRCGGCCTSELLSCKPIVTSILNITVFQLHYNFENHNGFQNTGTKTFSLEQHDRCACTCKQVAEDCDLDIHEYKPHECRCACRNAEEAALCTGPKKTWDSINCVCRCRSVRMCSTGSYFNNSTCRCDRLRQS